MKGWIAAVVGILATLVLVNAADAQQGPEFRLGFKALADQIPDVVGVPLDNEQPAANGDSLQRTSNGLMAWRKADNWTAFTDGATTWINGPEGVQNRPNSERLTWEKELPAPTSTPQPTLPPIVISTEPPRCPSPMSQTVCDRLWEAELLDAQRAGRAIVFVTPVAKPSPTPKTVYVPVPVPVSSGPSSSSLIPNPVEPVLPVPSGGVLESQIEGNFEGWDGDTIFKLTNGQIWQQARFAFHYHYAFRPNIVIYPTSDGWMMKVEDVTETIQVKRLK